jgi:hypothetical protein
VTPRREAELILRLNDGDLLQALDLLDRQLGTLHTRAQVLMSLAGVVVTVTGFSGRTIAGTSPLGQASIVAGLAVVLTSAVWLYARVMRIRWFTSALDAEPADALEAMIERRNRKTAAYQIGGAILCAGFALYCLAIASMLLSPAG